jgi:hypothetical protein
MNEPEKTINEEELDAMKKMDPVAASTWKHWIRTGTARLVPVGFE